MRFQTRLILLLILSSSSLSLKISLRLYQSHEFSSEKRRKRMIDDSKVAYASVLSFLSVFLIILVLLLILICRKKPVRSQETLLSETRILVQYPLIEIDSATDGFNERRIAGKGRLGKVYLAEFPNQQLVALKRIHPRLVLSNAGFGFSSVLKTLSLARHPNVVPILGFSEGPGERIIVMEFVGMASLDYYLQGNTDVAGSPLSWEKRLEIAAGAARGLEYLHEGITPNIVHGCVKSSKILLDNFRVKLCDFGLSAFLLPKEKRGVHEHIDEAFTGNVGYSKESDVYGFGVVLLEILTGRRCRNGLLAREATKLIKENRVSEVLDKSVELPSDIEALIRMAKVASACIGNSRKSRPSMSQVAAILSSLKIKVRH